MCNFTEVYTTANHLLMEVARIKWVIKNQAHPDGELNGWHMQRRHEIPTKTMFVHRLHSHLEDIM